jgi:anti-anti-sigma factor
MQLQVDQIGEVLVLRVNEPQLDRKNSSRFKTAVASHLRPGAKIALSFEQIQHVDGPGCGALLALQRQVKTLGGEVKIFALPPSLRTLFQKVHLHKQVATYNRREEALHAFGGYE